MKNPSGAQYAYFIDDRAIHIDRQDDGSWRLAVRGWVEREFPQRFLSPEQAELYARRWARSHPQ